MARSPIPLFVVSLVLAVPAVAAPVYEVAVTAPGDVRDLLAEHLDVMKWREYDDMTPEQLERLYQAMPADAKDLLSTRGYFNPRIETAFTPASGSTPAEITLTVEPGEPVVIDKVDLRLDGPIRNDDDIERRERRALRAWTLKEGETFSQPGWDGSKKAALLTLLADRYPTAKLAESRAVVDPGTDKAQLSAHYDSGPRYALGALSVTGLNSYPRQIVERLAGFSEGDPYRQQTLLDFQTRLQNTPYFASVFVRADLDPATADAAPVNVDVVEGPQQKVSFGLGYSTDSGERGEMNYRHVNVLNRGWIFDAGARLERDKQSAGVQLALPLDEKLYTWGGFARYEHEDANNLTTDLYRYGVSRSRTSRDIDRSISLTYVGERASIDSEPGSNYREALMLGWAWTRRDLDNPLNPRRGYAWRVELAGAVEGVLTDTSFIRSYGKGAWYLPLGKKMGRMILRGEVGQVFARDGNDVPNDVLFRTGGSGSVRGYGYQDLGVKEGNAIVGGRVLGVVSAEYQYPVIKDWAAAVFADAGNAAENWQNFDVAVGYGVGARWSSPVGPLALDLAYGQRDARIRLHFSLDMSF